MGSLTPKTYVMAMTAEEIEKRLLSIDNFLLKALVQQNLLGPSADEIPSTQCIVDALGPIVSTLGALGDLANKDSVSLDSVETAGTLPLSKGGTGATTLPVAQQNLGILTQTEIQDLIDKSIPEVQTLDLSSNQVSGVLPLSKGGTGSATPSVALKNLGIHDAGGKIPAEQLPDIATHEVTTYTANTELDMTSLNAEKGDFCIRLDTSQSFILKQKPAATFSNWQEILNDSYKRITPQVFQALKRAHAVYGKILVEGSFEQGATLTTSSDVVVRETTGETFTWTGTFPKTVSAGSSPASDPHWVIVPLGEAIVQAPVLAPQWIQKRSAMWTGYAPQDGQLLSRDLYPDAFAGILAGMLPVCSDADWLANPGMRGCATLGDGSTTFRLPDLNGAQPGSYGPVYLGGGTADGGTILRDRIQNITGTARATPTYGLTSPSSPTGAFYAGETLTGNLAGQTGGADNDTANRRVLNFDASRVARTGDTTRPITAEGCIAIKLFGAVQNTGSADAAALATAVAALAARVTALEARKFTTLIPTTYPSGAPHDTHETVDAALPTNLAVNTRYVLTNPFGVNTRVSVVVEIYINGKWVTAGFSYSSSSGQGYGVSGAYVQGEGIVIQTGSIAIATTSAYSGGAGGVSTNITSAPCRVAIRKWEV